MCVCVCVFNYPFKKVTGLSIEENEVGCASVCVLNWPCGAVTASKPRTTRKGNVLSLWFPWRTSEIPGP